MRRQRTNVGHRRYFEENSAAHQQQMTVEGVSKIFYRSVVHLLVLFLADVLYFVEDCLNLYAHNRVEDRVNDRREQLGKPASIDGVGAWGRCLTSAVYDVDRCEERNDGRRSPSWQHHRTFAHSQRMLDGSCERSTTSAIKRRFIRAGIKL